MFGSLFAINNAVSAAGTVVTALAAVVSVALAFKLAPAAVTWGLGRIGLGGSGYERNGGNSWEAHKRWAKRHGVRPDRGEYVDGLRHNYDWDEE